MRRLIQFFVKNHIFADLLTVVVICFGLYAMYDIRRVVFPNVNFDIISISTIFPGATPEEVEKLITNPIEQDLKEVDGIKKLQSTSIENRSGIVVYLDPDQTTEEDAKSDIKDVIDKLEDLPEGAEDPMVVAMKTRDEPIIEVALYGDIDDLELRRNAKILEKELESISGVSKVSLRGDRALEVRVEADPTLLARYRVTLNDVIQALRLQNQSIPSGPMDDPTGERVVRVVGDFKTLQDVENTVIRANDLGRSFTVKDVAKVRYDLERPTLLNHINGIKSISLTVAKKEKSDAIKVVDEVKAHVEKIMPSLNKNLKAEFVNDFSYYIRNRLSIVTSNLLIGLLCVLLILPLLLPIRFAFLVALGEPFAFLGAILVLYWTDQTINLISMMGLIIVSGILVDDSIVVTENAVRRIEGGEDPKDAAVEGTMQIFGPLTASVATCGVVFLPMAFMSGIFGKFIVEIPVAVLTCLIVSLFETYFILPAHIAHWIKPMKPKALREVETTQPNFFTRVSNRSNQYWTDVVEVKYAHSLKVILNHRYLVLGAILVFFVISVIAGGIYAKKRFILFPPDGVEIFFIRTEAPTGTSLSKHAELVIPVEKAVAQLPKNEVINFVTNVGIQQQDPHDPFTRRGSEFAQLAVYMTPENERDRNADEIIEELRSKLKDIPGFVDLRFDRINPGPPTGKAVSLGVRAKTYDEIMVVAKDLKERLAKIPGVTDIADSYTLGKKEVQIHVDSELAASTGVSVQAVGFTTRAAFEGHIATSIRTLDEDQDVRVSLPAQAASRIDILDKIFVPNMMGNLIPLRQISRVEEGQGLLSIQHEANERQVNVTAGVDVNVTSSLEVNALLKDMLPEINDKYPNVNVNFGGEDEDTQESFESLGRTFLVALAGVYLILVLTFGNLYQPTVVMLTVPLGVVSVLWAFILHGLPISFMGCLGTVALVGVIVNNAIILVDFINQNKLDTGNYVDGIILASKDRLRPIFLTTVTTVVGILPTAYGIGGLDKFVVPIAMSLGWGLMFGALLTSFVFPPVLAALEDVRSFIKTRKFKILRTS